MFRIGQKVVCVDDSQPTHIKVGRSHDLRRGRIYTVNETGLVHPHDPDRLPCIAIAENYGTFWAHRFRPVVEKKTDISIFTAILRRETIDDGPVVAKPRTRVISDSGLSHD